MQEKERMLKRVEYHSNITKSHILNELMLDYSILILSFLGILFLKNNILIDMALLISIVCEIGNAYCNNQHTTYISWESYNPTLDYKKQEKFLLKFMKYLDIVARFSFVMAIIITIYMRSM